MSDTIFFWKRSQRSLFSELQQKTDCVVAEENNKRRRNTANRRVVQRSVVDRPAAGGRLAVRCCRRGAAVREARALALRKKLQI